MLGKIHSKGISRYRLNHIYKLYNIIKIHRIILNSIFSLRSNGINHEDDLIELTEGQLEYMGIGVIERRKVLARTDSLRLVLLHIITCISIMTFVYGY